MLKLNKIKINKKRLISEFFELVKIDSISGEEDKICHFLEKRFKRLGAIVKKDAFGNLIIKVRGQGAPLLLALHMDTVEPGRNVRPYIEKGLIKSKGRTILGADNKSPIAAVIELLEIIREQKVNNRTLEITITREEENISRGAKNLDFSLLKSKEGLVPDSATPFGTITLAAPSIARFDVEVFGQLAHVKEPEKGVNAIKCALNIASQIPVGKVGKETTVNIAFIKGGVREAHGQVSESRTNTISDYVKFSGEIRGFSNKEQLAILQKIKKVCKAEGKRHKAKVLCEIHKLTACYKISKDDSLIRKASKIFKQLNYEPKYINSFGGSDANVFNQKGIKAIVISSAQKNTHSTEESVEIAELVSLVKFLAEFIR